MASPQPKVSVTPDWIEAVLVQIIEASMLGDINGKGDKRNLGLARAAAMDLAKLKGFIVERKQIAKATVRLDAMNRDQLRNHLATMLDELEPGARAELRRVLEAPIDIQPVVVAPQRRSK